MKEIVARASIKHNNLLSSGFIYLAGHIGEGIFESGYAKIRINDGMLLLEYYEFSDLENINVASKTTYFSLFSDRSISFSNFYELHDSSYKSFLFSLDSLVTEPTQINSILNKIKFTRENLF